MTARDSARVDLGAAWWVPAYLRAFVVASLLADLAQLFFGRAFTFNLALVLGWFMARGIERRSERWRIAAIAVIALDLAAIVFVACRVAARHAWSLVPGLAQWHLAEASPALGVAVLAATASLAVAPLIALLHPRTVAAFRGRCAPPSIGTP